MFARLASLWRNLAHRGRVDRELDEEVRAVFDLLVDEKTAQGLSLERARRAAALDLGMPESIKQQVREARAGASLDAVLKDLSYGSRVLRANPGFTLVVVLSLAAGIGANSAMFSVANAVMLRSLPVPEPGQLRMVQYRSRLPIAPDFSYPFFEQLRAGFPNPRGLAAMSRVAGVRAELGAGAAEAANLQLVSGEFFDVLRLRPQAGRLLTPADNLRLGGHPVAVISDAFWRRRFGGAADAVGREFTANGVRLTVVGVAPAGFSGVWLESPVDAWVPLMLQHDLSYMQSFSAENADFLRPWIPQDGVRWLELIARADRSNGPEFLALNAVFRPRLLNQVEQLTDPDLRRLTLDRHLALEAFATGASTLRNRFRAPLVALMAMVGLLLLIACANTANLLLARASSRQREMAVRLSIGASRRRIVGQLLTESVLLGALAAGAGLAVAPLAAELLVRMTLGVESGPLPFSIGVDRRVLAFTAAVGVLTSFLFGFAPALRATDVSLATALKSSGRGTHRGARLSLAKTLVVAQVALSLLLAVGAGLFARSFGNLASQPLGVEPAVIWASMNTRVAGYQEAELAALYRRIVARLEALPGVQSATIAMCGLMTGCRSGADGLAIAGYVSQPGEQVWVQENHVGPRYFSTVGMTIVAGRDFDERDFYRAARPIAIVNEAMVRKYFQNRDPLGQRFGYDEPDREIVGVVRDARVNAVRDAAEPMAFYPFDDTPVYAGSLHLRTVADPQATRAALDRVLREAEPRLPVGRVTTVAQLAADSLRQDRLIARLTGVLGVMALALACLGLYGLMSYAVRQRTAELGIRFALGAPRSRVLWMVFRESLTLTLAGLAIGLPAAIVASRLVGGLLFGVPPNDPLTLSAAAVVLLTVGSAAAYFPARRAGRVDPVIALREE